METKNTKLVKIETPELELIDKSKAQKIKNTFEPMVKMLEDFESAYLEIVKEKENGITQEICNKAKRIRLAIGKVRIETGKLKDNAKEYLKLEDRAIMGVHNILVYAVKEKEDNLKEIENYFEIQEQKRLEKLQLERVEMLSKYVEDANERDLSSMEDDVWSAYFGTKKKEYEDRIEAEKQAEIERIAKEKAEAKEKLEAERKAKEPIKKQMEDWIDKFEIPEISIKNEKTKLIKEKFNAFKIWAKTEINNL